MSLQVSFTTRASYLNDPEIEPNKDSPTKLLSLESKAHLIEGKEEFQVSALHVFELLPYEIWYQILSFIDTAPILLTIKQVDKRFSNLVRDYVHEHNQSLNLTDPQKYWQGIPEQR